MTPEKQEADSMKWERTGSVMVRQLSSGLFAMYHFGGCGNSFWIGPGEDLLAAYAARPAPSPVSRPTPVPRSNALGIAMEFKI